MQHTLRIHVIKNTVFLFAEHILLFVITNSFVFVIGTPFCLHLSHTLHITLHYITYNILHYIYSLDMFQSNRLAYYIANVHLK